MGWMTIPDKSQQSMVFWPWHMCWPKCYWHFFVGRRHSSFGVICLGWSRFSLLMSLNWSGFPKIVYPNFVHFGWLTPCKLMVESLQADPRFLSAKSESGYLLDAQSPSRSEKSQRKIRLTQLGNRQIPMTKDMNFGRWGVVFGFVICTQLRVLPPKMEFSYVFPPLTVSLGPSDVWAWSGQTDGQVQLFVFLDLMFARKRSRYGHQKCSNFLRLF